MKRNSLAAEARSFLNEGKPKPIAETAKPSPPARKEPVSLRLPEDLVGEMAALSGRRKRSRQEPWKLQDLYAEALRDYLAKQQD
jgi:uncharacterized protein (DUF4415 family)